MAKVQKLYPFDDLSLIEKYASKFSMDPDYVYDNTSFGTLMNFHILWKESEEYAERFNSIWQEINTVPTR